MNSPAPSTRTAGFTMVELLLAIALGVLVAGLLAALIHSLWTARESQAGRARGPQAARAALRVLSREIACAFAPPVKGLVPLKIETSTEPGKPETVLAFYAPVPADGFTDGRYDIAQITYEVARDGAGLRELRRIAVPCSGPGTNAPVTNRLLNGRFTLAIEALTNGTAQAAWPPPNAEAPVLPGSLRLSLAWQGEPSIQTEVLIQAAHGISSPIERPDEKPAEE